MRPVLSIWTFGRPKRDSDIQVAEKGARLERDRMMLGTAQVTSEGCGSVISGALFESGSSGNS